MLYENGDLARLTSVCGAEQLYTDAALVLDASTRVAAVSGSGANDLHFMHEHTVDFSPFSAHLMLYENGDLARLTSVCDAEQLYTDAALVLDASTRLSTRVAAVSGKVAPSSSISTHAQTQSTFDRLSRRTLDCYSRGSSSPTDCPGSMCDVLRQRLSARARDASTRVAASALEAVCSCSICTCTPLTSTELTVPLFHGEDQLHLHCLASMCAVSARVTTM